MKGSRVTDERVADLEANSIMLGQIAVLVEDWCLVDDVTTVDAVKLMLCDLEEHRAAARRGEILARYPTS